MKKKFSEIASLGDAFLILTLTMVFLFVMVLHNDIARAQTETEKETISLTGQVSRKDEKGRIYYPGGVTLHLINPTKTFNYKVKTDKDGNYRFSEVKPGKNYYLIAITRLEYTDYQKEIIPVYFKPANPNPIPYSYPYPDNLNIPTMIKKNEEDTKSKETGKKTVTLQKRQVPTGFYYGSGYYLPPGTYPYYPVNSYSGCYQIERPVKKEINVSWHLRMNLDSGGAFSLDLNPANQDPEFVEQVKYHFDPVSKQLYPHITNVFPVKIKNENVEK
ncbi:MAG: carboxypeptidase-like regulatory domain-containing protein [Vulcanimicrobiota bacterium]